MIHYFFTLVTTIFLFRQGLVYDYSFENKQVKIDYNFVKISNDHYIEALVTHRDTGEFVKYLNILSSNELGTVSDTNGKLRLKLPEVKKGKIVFYFAELTDDSFIYNLDEVKIRDGFQDDFTRQGRY